MRDLEDIFTGLCIAWFLVRTNAMEQMAPPCWIAVYGVMFIALLSGHRTIPPVRFIAEIAAMYTVLSCWLFLQ